MIMESPNKFDAAMNFPNVGLETVQREDKRAVIFYVRRKRKRAGNEGSASNSPPSENFNGGFGVLDRTTAKIKRETTVYVRRRKRKEEGIQGMYGNEENEVSALNLPSPRNSHNGFVAAVTKRRRTEVETERKEKRHRYNLRRRKNGEGNQGVFAHESNLPSHGNFDLEFVVLALEAPKSRRAQVEAESGRKENLREEKSVIYYVRRKRKREENEEVPLNCSPQKNLSNVSVISTQPAPATQTIQVEVESERNKKYQEESNEEVGSNSIPSPKSISEEVSLFSSAHNLESERDDFGLYGESESHDFDYYQSMLKCEVNQIWALFDNDLDLMPRSYAQIKRFLLTDGRVEVVLLEPHPISDEEMNWYEEKLPMACGTFKAEKSTTVRNMSTLSHQIVCENVKPTSLFYRIYPRKGEVWAIYNGWCMDWTYSDFKNHSKYKIVEILSDFTQGDVMTVAALNRSVGLLSVYERQMHDGSLSTQQFSKKDLLCFSHRILAIGLGDETSSFPKGSWMINPMLVSLQFESCL